MRDSANRIKQAHTAKTSKEASKLKKQAEHAYRSGKKISCPREKGCNTICKGAKRTVSGIKTAVKTGVTAVKSLGAFLAAGGWIVVLLVIVLGVIGGIAGSSGSSSAGATKSGGTGLYIYHSEVCFTVWNFRICTFNPSNHDAGIRRQIV